MQIRTFRTSKRKPRVRSLTQHAQARVARLGTNILKQLKPKAANLPDLPSQPVDDLSIPTHASPASQPKSKSSSHPNRAHILKQATNGLATKLGASCKLCCPNSLDTPQPANHRWGALRHLQPCCPTAPDGLHGLVLQDQAQPTT